MDRTRTATPHRLAGARVLVAGGASLVGSHLTRALLERDVAEVIVFDPLAVDARDSLGVLTADARVTMVPGDLTRRAQIVEHMADVDRAVNLAAVMTIGVSRDPAAALDLNIRGHLNFLEAARLRGVAKVVLASSNGVYGYDIGGPVGETEPHHHHGIPPAAAIYGSSKIIGEHLCRMWKARHGLDYLILRFSTVYGEGQHDRAANALYILDTFDRLIAGLRPQLFGDGSESKDFVYAGDVARALCLALDGDQTDAAVNVSGGEGISTAALVSLIGRLIGRDAAPDYLEDSDRVRLPTGPGLHFTNTLAKALLGWQPLMPLDEGIRRLLKDHARRRGLDPATVPD
ncbi:NAD-dependent epimerase/dehydratase family protein [Roseospira visakhapatnamensis]|uniref:UDP-glucose 4-epimerase n=1 Tax=Roseospira visakhapatnamensis TaxID=390880 RepID=A0A7W6RC11_9PROT|nr:NAD-dependent epimerase/dehydratase family protein [Roseospira visakhapatnamensis]MBB4265643.1 UDP-glucose 4-epimerase [Roseospira visakhapatnamensis]